MKFLEEERLELAKKIIKDRRPTKPASLLGPKSLQDCKDVLLIFAPENSDQVAPLLTFFSDKGINVVTFSVEKKFIREKEENKGPEPDVIYLDKDFSVFKTPVKRLISHISEKKIDWVINLYDGVETGKIHFLTAELPVTMKIGIYEKGFENYYDFMINKGKSNSFDNIIDPILNFAGKIRKNLTL